jgi:ribokinase
MSMQIRNKAYDIVTFGDMCVDLLLTGGDVTPQFGQVERLVDDYTLEMGGSCCIFACQAAKLGLRVGILGRVGADDFGQLMVRRLGESGVDTRHVVVDPCLKTGLSVALCRDDDRAILTYMGSICAIAPEEVTDNFLGSARHLHHGSYFLHTRLRPQIAAIFRRAQSLGLSTSLDTNWDPAEQWNSELHKLLPLTDIVFPNDQEALRMSRCADLDEATAWFGTQGVRIITIKRGAAGAELHDGQEHHQLTTTPVDSGDSVGAGDSFDAGFLAGWLRGLSLTECLRIACDCGRSVAARIGGLQGQLTWDDVAPRLKG